MLRNKFVMATLILLIGGFISKFLGFILKIIITRLIGLEGIGLYSLVMPTFGLFTTIAIFSFPIAISKIVAEEKKRSKNVLLSVIPVSILMNVCFIILIFIFAPVISEMFLKEPRTYYPILCIALTMPFIGISSIIKGYFWGKQRMLPYIISNISEQVVRLSLLIFFVPILLEKSLVLTISMIILVNVLSETVSIIVMLLCFPKKANITKSDLVPVKENIKEVMDISIPSTSSKIVGSIAYFFEPVILTNTLLFVGYSSSFILEEYGILNGYSLSLLLLPQFFSQSISTALIPEVSKLYNLGDKRKCKKRVKQIILLSLSIGFLTSLIIFLFPEFFLKLLFNDVQGVNYIKLLAPFMLLYFIDLPIISSLQALNKAKENMIITILGSILKLFLIFSLSLLKIGLYGLVIAIIVNMMLVTYLNYRALRKALR